MIRDDLKNTDNRRRAPFQGFIVVLTVIAIALVALLGERRLSQHRQEELNAFGQRQLGMARSMALGIETYLDSFQHFLETAASCEDQRHQAFGPLCFRQMAAQFSGTSLRLLGADGHLSQIYPATGWRGELVGHDFSAEDYFQEVMGNGKKVFSQVVTNEQGEQRLRIAVPVFQRHAGETSPSSSQDRLTGVLVGSLDPSIEIARLVGPVLGDNGNDVLVMNTTGLLLFPHQAEQGSQDGAAALLATGVPGPVEELAHLRPLLAAGTAGMSQYLTSTGQDHQGQIEKLVAFTPVRFHDEVFWSLAITAPPVVVDKHLQVLRRSELLASSLVGLILLLAGSALLITANRWSARLNREVVDRTRELRETRDYLDKLIRYANAPIMVWSPDQRVTLFNRAFQKLSGRTEAEMIGQPLAILFPADSRAEALHKIEDAATGARWEGIEIPIRREDGEIRQCLWNFASIFAEKQGSELVATIAQGQDITERLRAEAEACRTATEWERTFNALDDVITILDPQMRIVHCNMAVADLFGTTPEKLVGTLCHELFRGSSVPCQGCPLTETLHDFTKHTAEIIHPALEKIFQVSVFPLLDERGGMLGAVHIARDITEHKRLESKFRQTQKMEAMGTLAGGIAHDFNNILAVILGYTDLAADHLAKDSPAYEDLAEVRRAGNRARDLVRQILAFSRQDEAGKAPLSPAPIVKEVLKLLRSTLPSSIEIHQHITAGAAKILADPTQIYQVLMNLCINAAHAMEKTGGELAVDLEEMTLDATAVAKHPTLAPGSYLALRIADTGIGMTPAVMARIFDPFFTTKEVGKGTGMGLAVAHGIVKDHGGDIIVQSEAGQGTTFLLLFPELQPSKVEAAGCEPGPLPMGKERVLVVDDEETLAKMLGRHLEVLGYQVVIRTSSLAALEFFRAAPAAFDLVITDQTMPRMKGTALAGELLRLRSDLPIILCTGYSEEVTDETARQIGLRAVFMKPLPIDRLARSIRDILDRL